MQTFIFAYIKPLDWCKVENIIEVILHPAATPSPSGEGRGEDKYIIHYLDEQGDKQHREVPVSHFMDTQLKQFSITVINPAEI